MCATHIAISNLGLVAQQILFQASEARVWGSTSRGVYLHLPPSRIIYITSEAVKGPLILNSNAEPLPLRDLKPGMPGEVLNGNIHFATPDLTICIDRAALWPVPGRADISPDVLAMRFERLDSLCYQVLTTRDRSLSDGFLADLVEILPPGSRCETNHRSSSRLNWRFTPSDWNPKGETALFSSLERILGLGMGLTPAGDDLVLGYLFVLNRWGDLLFPGLEAGKINRWIQPAAYRKTVLLSANLIECATLGLADERLILTIDGIMTGEPPLQDCASYLLDWGNSSGAYALLGMALAILSG